MRGSDAHHVNLALLYLLDINAILVDANRHVFRTVAVKKKREFFISGVFNRVGVVVVKQLYELLQ